MYVLQDQKPSPKYVEQARKFAGDTAASKIADPPTINKGGGAQGKAEFAPSQMPGVKAAGKSGVAPMDIRGGARYYSRLHECKPHPHSPPFPWDIFPKIETLGPCLSSANSHILSALRLASCCYQK